MTNHSILYEYAEYYDIAFDFRDVPQQCSFLQTIYTKYLDRKPTSFLELGAGPAWHAIEFARQGIRSCALDLSPAMVEYGLDKAKKQGTIIEYINADMIDYSVDHKYDLAVLLLDTASYLLDNDSVYRHFNSVHQSLTENGIYIMELSHPKDVFRVGQTTQNSWKSARNGKTVTFQWGEVGDVFDPIKQIAEVTVIMTVEENQQSQTFRDIAPQRCFTINELKALVDASQCFRLLDTLGDFDENITLGHKKAWRIIAILQKNN